VLDVSDAGGDSTVLAGDSWKETVVTEAGRLGALGERVLGFAYKDITGVKAEVNTSLTHL